MYRGCRVELLFLDVELQVFQTRANASSANTNGRQMTETSRRWRADWFVRIKASRAAKQRKPKLSRNVPARHCAAERTLDGAFPGAMPVLIGYVGAKGKLDAQAWELTQFFSCGNFRTSWRSRGCIARTTPERDIRFLRQEVRRLGL